MRLYAILEDVDLGYHCIGIFSDPLTAEGHMRRLLEARWQMRNTNSIEKLDRPDDLGKFFAIYIQEFILDDTKEIEYEVSWRKKACRVFNNWENDTDEGA